MIKIKKNILAILIAFIFIVFTDNTSLASSTYKVNEKILFGRNYEFEKVVNGTVTVSGAVNDIQNIGDKENDEFVSEKLVKVEFTPSKIGVYKLKINVDAKTEGGVAVNRSDIVYFLVTENGEELSSEKIEEKILENLNDNEKKEYQGYLNRPYVSSINVTNASIVEKVEEDRKEYTLKIDRNTQEIKFDLVANDKDAEVEGNLSVNPNFQQINVIVIKKGDLSNTYTFRWEKPEIEVFMYHEKDEEKELFYDITGNRKFDGLETTKTQVKGNEYTVFVDASGSMLIPLKSTQLEEAGLYTFTSDGEILNKFSNFINIDGNIYGATNFKKIFNEDLRLFNLEEVSITNLNGIQGYKINRAGYEGDYFVRLQRPDGHESWYQYNITAHKLVELDLPENIFETQLASFFGVTLEHDYKKFDYSYYDLGLMAIAFIAFVFLLVMSLRHKK